MESSSSVALLTFFTVSLLPLHQAEPLEHIIYQPRNDKQDDVARKIKESLTRLRRWNNYDGGSNYGSAEYGGYSQHDNDYYGGQPAPQTPPPPPPPPPPPSPPYASNGETARGRYIFGKFYPYGVNPFPG